MMLTFVWKNKQARITEGGEEEGLGVGITTRCADLSWRQRADDSGGPRSCRAMEPGRGGGVRRVMKDASQFPAAVMIRQVK